MAIYLLNVAYIFEMPEAVMTIDKIIDQLKRATAPNRALDTHMARLLGYKKIVPPGSKSKALVWLGPDDTPKGPPFFTSSIDDAKELAEMVAPGCAAAVTFGGESVSSTINDGQRVHAATPPLALCLAAMVELAKVQA